ncbi:MAG: oligosaccharide flippase family protein [Alloprevotella sp.]|nr:oligosaccharide flippase family protein [Alloprevotella sp.]
MVRLQMQRRQLSPELVDSFYLVVLQGVNKLLPLFVLPWLMQKLGAGGYGYVGFALSVVQYIALIVDFGFDLSATKRVAVVRDNRDLLTRTFWAVVWAKTLLLLASVLFVLLLIAFVPTFRSYGWAILFTLPMAVGSAYTFMWMFQGIGKVRLIALMNTASKLLLLPLIFLLVRTPDDYLLAALLQSLVFLLTAVVSCLWLWRHRVVDSPVFLLADMKREVKDSLPLFLSRASTSVYTQLFVIILGFFCTREAVGRYTSAETVMRALCFVLYIPVTQAFFPRISALSEANRPLAITTFGKVRWLVLGAMSVVTLALFVSAPYVVAFLGADYAGLDVLLRVMAFTPIFIGVGAVYGQMGLVALGDGTTRKHFRNVYFIVALVSLVLVSVLTPLYLERGAAIALFLSELLVMLLMFYYCQKSRVLTS